MQRAANNVTLTPTTKTRDRVGQGVDSKKIYAKGKHGMTYAVTVQGVYCFCQFFFDSDRFSGSDTAAKVER